MATLLELRAITGTQTNKKLLASERITKIGSASDNDIVLFERQIESHHCELHQMFDRYFIVPLTPNSRGISLNGLPVSGRSRISAGDVLTLGATSYRLSVVEQLEREVGGTSSNQPVPRLGEYFIRRNLMSLEQVTKTAKRQTELSQNGQRIAFGQLAYELGYISRNQLEIALADQRNDFNERFRD